MWVVHSIFKCNETIFVGSQKVVYVICYALYSSINIKHILHLSLGTHGFVHFYKAVCKPSLS